MRCIPWRICSSLWHRFRNISINQVVMYKLIVQHHSKHHIHTTIVPNGRTLTQRDLNRFLADEDRNYFDEISDNFALCVKISMYQDIFCCSNNFSFRRHLLCWYFLIKFRLKNTPAKFHNEKFQWMNQDFVCLNRSLLSMFELGFW